MDTTEIINTAYRDERSSAMLYHTMAEVEKDTRLAEVYRRIAQTEAHHAEKWVQWAKDAGIELKPFKPSWRTRTLIALGKRFGPQMILPIIQNMEQNGSQQYAQMEDAMDMTADEQSHARLMSVLSRTVHGGVEGSLVMQLEGRHRSTGGNALRAAVMGANDGLVSNLSLVMGVAGATLAGNSVLIAGVAGLLAGSISMALGEWLSVNSSREMYENQIKTETLEIETAPEEEAEELALIYEARGLSKDNARLLAGQILSDSSSALETLAREELGVDPKELGGSPWEAAITSFLLFSVGAIIPVAPFIFTSGMTALVISIGVSALGLFGLGAAITLFTGRTVLFSGMRMVLFGLVAAAVTFGIGKLIGGSVAG